MFRDAQVARGYPVALHGSALHQDTLYQGRLFPYWERAILRHEGQCPKHARKLLGHASRDEGGARTLVHKLVKASNWASTDEVQQAAPKAKVLNRGRVRFEVAGGNYRLIAAFDFRRQVAFVKFVGTHAEYDRVDALTVSQY